MAITKYHISKYGVGKENIELEAIDNDRLDPEAGKWVRVALSGGAANAISFAWQNPESSKIIIDRVLLYVTTAGGSGATMDIGVCGSATATSDNLIDGATIDSVGLYDNISDGGTNGKARQIADEKGGTNDYVTGKILGADSANLAGYVYIHYRTV